MEESQQKPFSLRSDVNHDDDGDVHHDDNASHDDYNGNGDNKRWTYGHCNVLGLGSRLNADENLFRKKQTNNGVMRVLLWRNDLAAIITALD